MFCRPISQEAGLPSSHPMKAVAPQRAYYYCRYCGKKFGLPVNEQLPLDVNGNVSDAEKWPGKQFRGNIDKVRTHMRDAHPQVLHTAWTWFFARLRILSLSPL